MNRTKIEWTDFTANPIRFRAPDGRVVWACEKLSAGCTNCYAEALSRRYPQRRAGEWNAATMATLDPFLDGEELRRMLTYKPASGKRVFVGDMTDVFGDWVADEQLDRLFAVFALRPDVTWKVLTKRAGRMRAYFADVLTRKAAILDRAIQYGGDFGTPEGGLLQQAFVVEECWTEGHHLSGQLWPLPNVWLGVSCEDQQRADERVTALLNTPAAVRFVSCEPLLGPVNLRDIQPMRGKKTTFQPLIHWDEWDALRGEVVRDRMGFQCQKLSWVIIGGESGPGARPCDVGWIRSVVQQCRAAGVPAFVKQVGSRPFCSGRRGEWKPRDRKGSDPSEWSEDLRVREFPRSAVRA